MPEDVEIDPIYDSEDSENELLFEGDDWFDGYDEWERNYEGNQQFDMELQDLI